MIDLYTWTTPNGRKASIMLEEVGLPYTVHPINIGKGDQHTPDFLRINPNNKIPAVVDHDGPGGRPLTVFESGAVLIYLAEKTGRLLPKDGAERTAALQWLMFQMGGVGPMFGQLGHFKMAAPEPNPYAEKRYTDESLRLLGVMDRRLNDAEYLAGAYSIADIATYPWILSGRRLGLDLAAFGSVSRWVEAVGGRAAVAKGMAVPDV